MDYSAGHSGYNGKQQYDKSQYRGDDDSRYYQGADYDHEEELENMSPEKLAQVDNFYVYDDVNKPYDPLVQPYSYFYVAVCGQVQYGQFMDMDGLQIKYAFVAGDDW